MAELDPAIRSHLQQPNRLYLAAFRDGSIKVGTSTLARAHKRLAEQGAWMARFVADTKDGVSVRNLEDLVTEVWSMPQSVSARRKVAGLVDPLPDDELDARLDEAARAVGQLMARTPDDRVTPLVGKAAIETDGASAASDTAEAASDTADGRHVASAYPLGERWRHPLADDRDMAALLDKVLHYPLSLTAGRHDLTVVTAIGRTLLVRRVGDDGEPGQDLFAIDPAPLFGLELDIGDYGSDEIAIQDSLF